MKKEVSKTSMNKSTTFVVSYCAIQRLLTYTEPFAYSADECGWACDYYRVDDVVISTGYRPSGISHVPYDMCAKYEKLAGKILDEFRFQEEAELIINGLLRQFVNEVKEVYCYA